MGLLNKKEILERALAKAATRDVEAFGGTVRIHKLSADAHDEFDESLWVKKGKRLVRNLKGARARYVALCLAGGDEAAAFTEAELQILGQSEALGAELDRLYEICREFNGANKTDEDIEKNSDGAGDT